MSPKVSNPHHDKCLSGLIKNLWTHLPILVLTHTSTTNSLPSPFLGLQNTHVRVIRAIDSIAFLGWYYFSGLRYKGSDWIMVSFQCTPVYSIQRPSGPSGLTLG